MDVTEQTIDLGGLPVHCRRAGDAPILYVHGVPTASWDWLPFLERIGGVAPDLPGFGRSGKPGDFDYSIEGYTDFLAAFTEAIGLERMTMVVHDWGGVGLAFAQRHPERIERLVLFNCVTLLPGYRWHRIARLWRTRGVGEIAMGLTTKWAAKQILREANVVEGSMPQAFRDRMWADFDHGTQRAILKLYRSAPPEVLERAGERLGEIKAPALILWSTRDPYIPERFGADYAEALGGEVTVELVDDAGHWLWIDRPDLVERVAGFIAAGGS